jgi:hypothetical protein
MSRSWEWEKTVAGRPGMSGDIAKIFKHEELKNPGVFALDAPPAAATLLAREVIQNSWDAARELRETDATAPQFQIEFRFQELQGAAKQSLVRALALDNHADRVRSLDRAKVGLSQRDCLTVIRGDEPIRVLEISEHAASGMYGPWEQNKSHMFLALLSIGFTEKFDGAGGSYGYGKAGLINGSRIRTVLAYTCFRERTDDPGVTRRLLGVTYWGPHDFNGANHPGIATLSAGTAGEIKPFENEAADEIARELGLELRDPEKPGELGTTFLLIDTPIEPTDLVRAVERSWWPAILEGDFVVTVVKADGSTLSPRPMRDPVLHTFIDAWEIAMGRSEPGPDDRRTELTGPDSPSVNGNKIYPVVGTLGLVADLSGWSFADQTMGPDDEVTHRGLIALTRSPRMVVEYLAVGQTAPYLRGVFIADPSIDELLRQTEPKAHDSWQTKAGEEVDLSAAAMAQHVIQRIRQTYSNHRFKLKPPAPPPEEVNLPFFSEIMKKVMAGKAQGQPVPVPDTRTISIRLEHEPQESGADGLIKMVGSASYSLSDHFKGESAIVNLTIAYRFIEDERVGDYATLEIEAPSGFTEVSGGVFTGVLNRGQEARFGFASAPYDPTWSGRLIVNGDVQSGQTDKAEGE